MSQQTETMRLLHCAVASELAARRARSRSRRNFWLQQMNKFLERAKALREEN